MKTLSAKTWTVIKLADMLLKFFFFTYDQMTSVRDLGQDRRVIALGP